MRVISVLQIAQTDLLVNSRLRVLDTGCDPPCVAEQRNKLRSLLAPEGYEGRSQLFLRGQRAQRSGRKVYQGDLMLLWTCKCSRIWMCWSFMIADHDLHAWQNYNIGRALLLYTRPATTSSDVKPSRKPREGHLKERTRWQSGTCEISLRMIWSPADYSRD